MQTHTQAHGKMPPCQNNRRKGGCEKKDVLCLQKLKKKQSFEVFSAHKSTEAFEAEEEDKNS